MQAKDEKKNSTEDNNQEKENNIQKNENDENNTSPSSLSNSDILKQNKKFIDNFFEKMSKRDNYSVTIGIFIILKNNNYNPLTKDEIYELLRKEYKQNPHRFIKYGKNNAFFENETSMKQACFLSIMENQAFNKTTKDNLIYISIDYFETVKYLKNLKIHKANVPMDEEDMNFLFSKIKKKRKLSNSINNNKNETNNNNNSDSITKKVHRKRGNVELPKYDLLKRKRNVNKIEQIELSDDTADEGGVFNINNSTSSLIDDIVSRKKRPKLFDKDIDNNISPPQSPNYRNNEEKKSNDNNMNNSSYNDNDNDNNNCTGFQKDIRIFKSKIKEIKNYLNKANPKFDEIVKNVKKEKITDKNNIIEDNDDKFTNFKNEVIKNKKFLRIIYLILKDEIKCLKNIMDIEGIFSKDIIEEHQKNIKNLEDLYVDALNKLCEGIEYLCKKTDYNNKQKLLKEMVNTSIIFKENGINMEELIECSNNLKKLNLQTEKIFSIEEIKEYYESIKNKLIKKIEKKND